MLEPIQLILIGFLLFAISRVYLQLAQHGLKMSELTFWIAIFSTAVVGVYDPSFMSYLANQLGIDRGSDLAIYFSILLLFYLIFRTNVHLENVRHEITKLVRLIALNDSPPPKRQRKSK